MAISPPTSPEESASAGRGRTSDLLLIELAKLQSDGEYLKRDIGELRSELRSEVRDLRADIKDVRSELRDVREDVGSVRDRLTRLEERVAHLPGKGFIVGVVTTAMILISGAVTIAPRLQAMTPPVMQSPSVR